MSKISIIGLKARDKALEGADYIAEAVKSTLGPFGLNAMMQKGNKITNDGHLISVELVETIKNEFARQGARIAQEASSKTNDKVGDATTTAWVLWQSIVKEAIRYLPNEKSLIAKKTPAAIKKWIEESKNEVITKLESKVDLVTSKEALIKSALVSVEDENIAEKLGSMQWDLGAEGIIIAEEVNDPVSSIERVEGIRLDNGFGTSHVVTNAEKQSLELDEISVLLTNYTIDTSDLQKFNTPIFTPLIAQKKLGIVIIARAFTSDAIKMCMESLKTGFAIFPVNAPYVNQTQIMHDIETVVGGRYIDVEESRLEDIHINDIGFAKRLVARSYDAIITGVKDKDSEKRILKRATELQKKLIGSQSDFEKKMIESRIAQLSNGFAILKVGAQTIVERQRLKDKCDDAVSAVRLALKGGTVKGAGLAFKEISEELSEDNILKRPLLSINAQIMASAPTDWIIEDWVRDPFLVLKCALENACDSAGTSATTNIVIANENPLKCNCKQSNDES